MNPFSIQVGSQADRAPKGKSGADPKIEVLRW